MVNYKALYYKMFNRMTDCIERTQHLEEEMKKIQQEAEELFIAQELEKAPIITIAKKA